MDDLLVVIWQNFQTPTHLPESVALLHRLEFHSLPISGQTGPVTVSCANVVCSLSKRAQVFVGEPFAYRYHPFS